MRFHFTVCIRYGIVERFHVTLRMKNIFAYIAQKPSVILLRSKCSNSIHLVLFLLLITDCRIMYIHKSVSEFLPRHWDFLGFLVPSSKRLIFMMNLDKSWNFMMFRIRSWIFSVFFFYRNFWVCCLFFSLKLYLKLVVVLH